MRPQFGIFAIRCRLPVTPEQGTERRNTARRPRCFCAAFFTRRGACPCSFSRPPPGEKTCWNWDGFQSKPRAGGRHISIRTTPASRTATIRASETFARKRHDLLFERNMGRKIMMELGRVSTETKGRQAQTWYLDNPCDPESGWSEYRRQCP